MKALGEISFTARVKYYPDGSRELLVSDRAVFRASGWEAAGWKPKGRPPGRAKADPEGEVRAQRRARARVRDLALCNPFRWFVTLTLDKNRVDRYDMDQVTPRLNAWLSNQVQRRGLAYVLVPERHKDGAIHFHGLFNDALEAVDSGTLSIPGVKKPRRPRSAAQRAAWLAEGAHPVYNLPGWSLGFTTAIELYGDYRRAVGYVCKYIGKQGEKPGGRWYYSGGSLREPEFLLADLDWRTAAEQPGAYVFQVGEVGATFVRLWEGAQVSGEG